MHRDVPALALEGANPLVISLNDVTSSAMAWVWQLPSPGHRNHSVGLMVQADDAAIRAPKQAFVVCATNACLGVVEDASFLTAARGAKLRFLRRLALQNDA